MTKPSSGGHYREALLLAVASPIIAELISGSAPPAMFIVPWVFALFVLFYGGAAIMIRELSVRWNTGWIGILLMGAAFGILQEGCSTRAFFDPAWPSLGPMVNHGRSLGVNWIWMLDAILYHAAYSMALPVLLVYQMFPRTQKQPWLGNIGLVSAAGLFTVALGVWLYSGRDRYQAPHSYLWISAGMAAVLCVLGARMKAQSPAEELTAVSPKRFMVLGFVITLGMVLQIYVVPDLKQPGITFALLVLLFLLPVRLLKKWSGNGAWSQPQQFGLIAGILGFFALMDFFQEFNPSRGNGARGASVVGLATLTLLAWMNWRNRKHASFLPVSGQSLSAGQREQSTSSLEIQ